MLFMYRLSGAEQHLQPVGQVKAAAAAQRSHNPLCLLTAGASGIVLIEVAAAGSHDCFIIAVLSPNVGQPLLPYYKGM